MGDLPNLEDVANKNFAKPKDYAAASRIVRQELQGLYEKEKIIGALFHGSSQNHEIKIGTDIDVFVLANTIYSSLDDIRRIYFAVKEKHNINVEFQPLISYNQAKKGEHAIQKSFWDILKLQYKPGDVVGNNPLEYLAENTATTPAQEFIGKKRNDLRRLVIGLAEPEFSEPYLKALSRMLNYTVFVPRHIYHVVNGRLHPDEPLSKDGLIEMYKKEFREIEPLAMDIVHQFQREKQKILTKEIITEIILGEYKTLLSWFSMQHPIIEKFILDNIELAKQTLKQG